MIIAILNKIIIIYIILIFRSQSIFFFLFRIISIIIGLIRGITTNKIKKFIGYSSISAIGYLFIMIYSMKGYTQIIPI